MQTISFSLFDRVCSFENLELAFKKARKGKSLKPYVIDFEKNLAENLLKLRSELLIQEYKPRKLQMFILRDPKTRKINKSDFRDRVIHHALCNVIEPIFDKSFIFDSYANRLGKGTFKAIERFDYFKLKVSKNNSKKCFILKADIRHYFETVDHEILLSIVESKISDENVLWLIRIILANYGEEKKNKGMPLGNLTSQFFANVYLNELDQFVKHELKAKFYIRYVDDFVLLSDSFTVLEQYKECIDGFLKDKLSLDLHPDKTRITRLDLGVLFLGFRIFNHHKLLHRKNIGKFKRKLDEMGKSYKEGLISREKVIERFEGWLSYISHADTYKYRRQITKNINQSFPISNKSSIVNVKKYERFESKIAETSFQFSQQKTLFLLKKGLRISQIAISRGLKESTVCEHVAKLIEHGQISVIKVLEIGTIGKIRCCIQSENDTLKDIMIRLNDDKVSFYEVNCVLASVKYENKVKKVSKLISWYNKTN